MVCICVCPAMVSGFMMFGLVVHFSVALIMVSPVVPLSVVVPRMMGAVVVFMCFGVPRVMDLPMTSVVRYIVVISVPRSVMVSVMMLLAVVLLLVFCHMMFRTVVLTIVGSRVRMVSCRVLGSVACRMVCRVVVSLSGVVIGVP